MSKDLGFYKCVSGIESALNDGESVIRIRRAASIFGRPDTFTRFKVEVGKLDSSGSAPKDIRSFIVSVSSNSGQVQTEVSTEIPDV